MSVQSCVVERASAESPVLTRRLQQLDPRAKIVLVAGLLITAVSTPPPAFAAFAGYATLLVGLFALAGAPPGRLLRRVAQFLPFWLLMTLPWLWVTPPPGQAQWPTALPGLESFPGSATAWNLGIKALLGLGCALLLTTLLPFERLLWGLERLSVPRLLLTLLQLTQRYGMVLQAEAARMQVARVARGGRAQWLWQAGSLGPLLGALFVRSGERAERVHQAMLARGFDGVSLTGRESESPAGQFGAAEIGWLAMVGLALALVRGGLS